VNGDAFIATLAGAGIVATILFIGPWTFKAPNRAVRWQLSALTVALLCSGAYLSFENIAYAISGAALVIGTKLFFNWRHARSIDYVAEEPLLSESVSPELAVQLENLGAEFKRRPRQSQTPPVEHVLLADDSEQPPALY